MPRWSRCCARIEAHVSATERLHADDTTAPVLAKARPSPAAAGSMAATFGRSQAARMDGGAPIAQTNKPASRHVLLLARPRQRASGGAPGQLVWAAAGRRPWGLYPAYEAERKPRLILEAACRAHGRRPFFALAFAACRGGNKPMADIELSARRKAEGKATLVISPIALEVVRRIDALFDIERTINGQTAQERRRVRQEKECAARCRPRNLDAGGARQALARQRRRQGHGLHAEALAVVHALPRGRAPLPHQQCRRADAARNCTGTKIMAFRRLRSRRRARRSHVQSHRCVYDGEAVLEEPLITRGHGRFSCFSSGVSPRKTRFRSSAPL